MDCNIGQHLAVEIDPGQLQPVDEGRIGQPVQTGTGIDALDPKPTEVALFGATVAIGVLQVLMDPLDSSAKRILGPASGPLGGLDDFADDGRVWLRPVLLETCVWLRFSKG